MHRFRCSFIWLTVTKRINILLGFHFKILVIWMFLPRLRPPDQHPLAHFRISGGIRIQTSSNLPVCDKEPITEYAFQIPPTGTRGRNWWSRELVNVVFSRQASANDFLEVSVMMREILSVVTLRLMVLMRLDLFFTGVPNFPPPKKISILRVGAERALLPRANFSCL